MFSLRPTTELHRTQIHAGQHHLCRRRRLYARVLLCVVCRGALSHRSCRADAALPSAISLHLQVVRLGLRAGPTAVLPSSLSTSLHVLFFHDLPYEKHEAPKGARRSAYVASSTARATPTEVPLRNETYILASKDVRGRQ